MNICFNGIRLALRRSVNGESGLNVYATIRKTGEVVRVIDYKCHRGLNYGKELSSGRWVVVGFWEER